MPHNTRINNLRHLKKYRKKLRNNLTPAEARFWTYVKDRRLKGRKFRRQHSIDGYILDFYCPAERLAIELDGEGHFSDRGRVKDYKRKKILARYGIKVLRFENSLVFDDPECVFGIIVSKFGWNRKTTPP